MLSWWNTGWKSKHIEGNTTVEISYDGTNIIDAFETIAIFWEAPSKLVQNLQDADHQMF